MVHEDTHSIITKRDVTSDGRIAFSAEEIAFGDGKIIFGTEEIAFTPQGFPASFPSRQTERR